MYILVIIIQIFYSKHSLEKMDGLGIEKSEIENIILKGMKWKENEDKWHASMAGMECVFIKKEGSIFVITVYKE